MNEKAKQYIHVTEEYKFLCKELEQYDIGVWSTQTDAQEHSAKVTCKISSLFEHTYQLIGYDLHLLYHFFECAFNQKDISSLIFSIEYIRANGIFYHDHEEQQDTLLEKIISISLNIIQQPEVLSNSNYMWYLRTVYDVFFYQIHLNEFSEKCRKLFFELSKQVLDSRFYELLEQNYQGYYDCLYFLEYGEGWFVHRKGEYLFLLILFKKLKIFTSYPLLEENWNPTYKLI